LFSKGKQGLTAQNTDPPDSPCVALQQGNQGLKKTESQNRQAAPLPSARSGIGRAAYTFKNSLLSNIELRLAKKFSRGDAGK
jgi:hypothetical protein